MRRTITAVPLLLVVAAASACSTGSAASKPATRRHVQPVAAIPTNATTSTSAATSTAKPSTQTNLQAMALRLDELPPGYTQGSSGTAQSSNVFCEAAKPWLPAPTRSVEVQYQHGALGPFITNAVGVYDDVHALFAAFEKSVAACRSFSENRADGTTTNGTFALIRFPNVGDHTIAARFSGTGNGFPFRGTVIMVVRGKTATTITMIDGGTDRTGASQRLAAFARAVSARLV